MGPKASGMPPAVFTASASNQGPHAFCSLTVYALPFPLRAAGLSLSGKHFSGP